MEVIEYKDSYSRVTLKCKKCGNTFSKTYNSMLKNSTCPHCNIKVKQKTNLLSNTALTQEDKQIFRANKYMKKIGSLSSGLISASGYTGSKDNIIAHCNVCNHEWSTRADHLLNRLFCPKCRKTNS